jgi:hypothetical protein
MTWTHEGRIVCFAAVVATSLDAMSLDRPARADEPTDDSTSSDRVRRVEGGEMFGYYDVEDFEAEHWKNEYPNAFSAG